MNWTPTKDRLPAKEAVYECLYGNGAVHERKYVPPLKKIVTGFYMGENNTTFSVTPKKGVWLSLKDNKPRGMPEFWKEKVPAVTPKEEPKKVALDLSKFILENKIIARVEVHAIPDSAHVVKPSNGFSLGKIVEEPRVKFHFTIFCKIGGSVTGHGAYLDQAQYDAVSKLRALLKVRQENLKEELGLITSNTNI